MVFCSRGEDIHWFGGSKSNYDTEEISLFHMLTWKKKRKKDIEVVIQAYWKCFLVDWKQSS